MIDLRAVAVVAVLLLRTELEREGLGLCAMDCRGPGLVVVVDGAGPGRAAGFAMPDVVVVGFRASVEVAVEGVVGAFSADPVAACPFVAGLIIEDSVGFLIPLVVAGFAIEEVAAGFVVVPFVAGAAVPNLPDPRICGQRNNEGKIRVAIDS